MQHIDSYTSDGVSLLKISNEKNIAVKLDFLSDKC